MIVDSVVWIALKYKRDKYHLQATTKFKEILKSKKKITVTDYIISETYAFLLRKSSYQVALDTLKMFFNSKSINILYNGEKSFRQTLSICEKHSELSFVDANIVLNMNMRGINDIFSYDNGFDNIKKIYRIH